MQVPGRGWSWSTPPGSSFATTVPSHDTTGYAVLYRSERIQGPGYHRTVGEDENLLLAWYDAETGEQYMCARTNDNSNQLGGYDVLAFATYRKLAFEQTVGSYFGDADWRGYRAFAFAHKIHGGRDQISVVTRNFDVLSIDVLNSTAMQLVRNSDLPENTDLNPNNDRLAIQKPINRGYMESEVEEVYSVMNLDWVDVPRTRIHIYENGEWGTASGSASKHDLVGRSNHNAGHQELIGLALVPIRTGGYVHNQTNNWSGQNTLMTIVAASGNPQIGQHTKEVQFVTPVYGKHLETSGIIGVDVITTVSLDNVDFALDDLYAAPSNG